MKTLNDFWACYEIGGVALVDMGVWHWMYEHPAASPAESPSNRRTSHGCLSVFFDRSLVLLIILFRVLVCNRGNLNRNLRARNIFK